MRWLVVFLALTGGAFAQSSEPSPRGPATQQTTQGSTPDQRGTEQNPLIVKTIRTPKSEDEVRQEERDQRAKAEADKEKAGIDRGLLAETRRIADYTLWLAAITFVVACVTGFLGYATWMTAKAAKGSADAVEGQLRAYVHVSDGSVTYVAGEIPLMILVIKNTGQTPAHHLTWRAKFVVARPTDMDLLRLDPNAVGTELSLPPGETAYYRYRFENWQPAFDEFLEKGELRFYAFGEIRYRDVFKKERFTDYRLMSAGRFDVDTGIAAGKFGPAPEGNNSD